MALYAEQILDGIMQGEKPLGVLGGFESPHLSFSSAGRLMRDFGSIVGVSLHTVSHVAEDVLSKGWPERTGDPLPARHF